MNRGDKVLVRAYGGKRLERVVLAVRDTYVLVCRPEVFEKYADADPPLNETMGFPREDVVPLVGSRP